MAFPPSSRNSPRNSRHRQGIYINQSILGERRTALHLLEEQRDALLHQLQTLIGKKQGEREQEAERSGVVQSLCSNGKMAERAAASLQKGKQQLVQKKTELSERRATLDALFEQLKRERLRSSTYLFPNDLRTHEMALLHTRLGLAADQRSKLRQLLDVLPLTVTGMGKSYVPNAPGVGSAAGGCGSQGGVAIAICGLRLPEKLALDTLQQEPAQQVALSASLGYMLLLTELLAAYIGGPVLHEGSFQGSTTVLWQQQSFWDRRPSSSHEVLPLFVEKGLSVLGAALGAATGSTAEAQTAKNSSSGWGPLSLLRRVSSNPSPPMPPSSTSPPHRQSGSLLHGSSPQQQQQWQQQWQWHQWPYRPPQGMEAEVQAHAQAKHANLDLAFNMLQRSASSLVHDKACDLGLTLPSSWGPFGWLVMLCAAMVQDDDCPHPRLGGVLSAAAGCVQSERHFAQQQRAQQEHAALHYHAHKQRQQQQQQQQQRALQQLQQHHQAPKLQTPSSQQTHHHQQQQQQRTSTSGGPTPPVPSHAQRAHPAPPRPTGATTDASNNRAGDGFRAGSEVSVNATTPGNAGLHALNGEGTPHLLHRGQAPPIARDPHHLGSDVIRAVGSAGAGATPAAAGPAAAAAAAAYSSTSSGEGAADSGSLQGPPVANLRRVAEGRFAGGVQAPLRVGSTSNHVQQRHQDGTGPLGPEEEEEGGWEEVGHQHILPPPPSAEEDVLQYVRALYGDGNADQSPS